MLRHHLLRWALMCAAATYGTLPALAGPAHTITVRRGDSLKRLASQYHVSARALAEANDISPNTTLHRGRKLRIPLKKQRLVQSMTMRRVAAIRGDDVSLRALPGKQSRRVGLLDVNKHLLVTARNGKWYQVKIGGKFGWVRGDHVKLGTSLSLPRAVARRQEASARRQKLLLAAKAAKHKRAIAKASAALKGQAAHVDAARANRKRAMLAKLAQFQAAAHRKAARLAALRQANAVHRDVPVNRSGQRRIVIVRRHEQPVDDDPDSGKDVIRTALSFRGVPYRFGGNGRGGIDCSGFTRKVYQAQGVSLPRTAHEQFHRGRPVGGGNLKPGDLVFFHTTRSGISHVGIYEGNGKFVHASSGGGHVQVNSLSEGYYRSRFRGARRVK